MKIKRFFAKDMRTAMIEVKEVLGPDAVIMSNKKVVGGIEIVAAIDYQAQSESELNVDKDETLSQLKEDLVQLSSQGAAVVPTFKLPNSIRSNRKESGEDFAKSLNSFFGKVNAQQVKKPLHKKRNNYTPEINTSVPPATLAEQQNWLTRNDNTASLAKPMAAANRNSGSNSNKDLEKITAEVASLRKLLEFQVSGLMWQEMERQEPVRAMIIKWLDNAGFSKQVADQLASYVPEGASSSEVMQHIEMLLQEKISIGNNEILTQGGAIALLGPTGVGKTTTIAKLAAQFALKYGPEQVALITTDNYRIGAYEQLSTYGKIMGCSVRVAKDADELSQILYQFREKRLVLIDTAGMGQRDVRLSEQLETLMTNSRVNIKSYLVVASTAQRRVIEEALQHFKRISLSGCILTKLDESVGLGEVLSVTMKHALPISYVTTGQRVPEDIEIAKVDVLIQGVLAMMETQQQKEQHQWRNSNEY